MGDLTTATDIFLLVCQRTDGGREYWVEEAYTSRDDAEAEAARMNEVDKGIPYQWRVDEVELHYCIPEGRERKKRDVPSHTAQVYCGNSVLTEFLKRLGQCGYTPELAPEDQWDVHYDRRTVLVHGAPVDGWPDLSLRRIEGGGMEFIWNGNIRVPVPNS